jgi:hypothetical protein
MNAMAYPPHTAAPPLPPAHQPPAANAWLGKIVCQRLCRQPETALVARINGRLAATTSPASRMTVTAADSDASAALVPLNASYP